MSARAMQEGKDYLYVVRDAETGEVLKVGSTSDLDGRLADYRTANDGTTAEPAKDQLKTKTKKQIADTITFRRRS